MRIFENFSVYISKKEFLQDFKILAGYKLKLPNRESSRGMGRVGMSAINN